MDPTIFNFMVTQITKVQVIQGYTRLRKHNLQIDWATRSVYAWDNHCRDAGLLATTSDPTKDPVSPSFDFSWAPGTSDLEPNVCTHSNTHSHSISHIRKNTNEWNGISIICQITNVSHLHYETALILRLQARLLPSQIHITLQELPSAMIYITCYFFLFCVWTMGLDIPYWTHSASNTFGFCLAFLYVNPISFRLFLTVRSQTLTPVSSHSFLICFVGYFLL